MSKNLLKVLAVLALALVTIGGLRWLNGDGSSQPSDDVPETRSETSERTDESAAEPEPPLEQSTPGEAELGSLPETLESTRLQVGTASPRPLVVGELNRPVGTALLSVWDISSDTGDILGYLGTVEACDRLYIEPRRTERIRSASMNWISSADGSFGLELDQLPPETRLLATVNLHGFEPWHQVFESREALLELEQINLATKPWTSVRVAGSEPSADPARVHVQALLPSGAIPESLPIDARSRRAFFKTQSIDNASFTQIPTYPGRVAIWAQQGDLRSDLYVGVIEGPVELVLGPTFAVGGRVTRESGEPLGAWAHVVASHWNVDRSSWQQVQTASIGEGGVYGPLSLPAEESRRYRLSVRWTEAGEADREFTSPNAGVSRTEDFEVGPNRDVWVHVWGSVPGTEEFVELGGAMVVARWTRPDGTQGERSKTTIQSGWVRFGGIDPGDNVFFSASAEGYERLTGHHHLMGAEGIAPFNLILEPGSEHRFRVTFEGQSVSECLICMLEGGSLQIPRSEWRVADPDSGEFTFPASQVDTWIQAALPGKGASRYWKLPAQVSAGSASGSSAESLRILPGSTGTGRAVTGLDRAPLPGARVSLVGTHNGLLNRDGAMMRVYASDDGRFEVLGLPPADGAMQLLVEAEGYSAHREYLQPNTAAGEPIDFGEVALEPLTAFVFAVQSGPGRVAQVGVAANGVRELNAHTVSAGQELRLTAVAPSLSLQVLFQGSPDFALSSDWIDFVDPSAVGRLDYLPPKASSLRTRARFPDAWKATPDRWPLRIKLYRDAGEVGRYRDVIFGLESDEILQPQLPEGGYRAIALDRFETELGQINLSLTEAQSDVLLDFDLSGSKIRLQRTDGGALAEARVAFDSGSEVLLISYAIVDAEGWLDRTLQYRPTELSGVLPEGSCFSGVPIDWTGASEGAAVGYVEVGPFESAQVVCRDSRGVVEGVSWELHPWGVRLPVATGESDAQGRLDLPRLMQGIYRLELAAPGYWPRKTAIQPGENLLRAWIGRRSRLDLIVQANGEPLADTLLRFDHLESGDRSEDWVAWGQLAPEALTTDQGAHLFIDGLPEGTYRITTHDGQLQGEVLVPSTAGDPQEIELAPAK